MKFRRHAPALLIGAVIFVVVSVTLISNIIFSGMTTSVEEGQLALMKSIVDFNLQGAEGKALARAALIADMPKTKELFAAQDRAALLAEYLPMFQVQKEKYGVDQAQFHLPPATSFLRLQSPDKFGDDLSKFRPMVVAVNRDQVAKKGFAIARTGPAIFGVVPVFDANHKHIGSFEIGIAFAGILDSLKAAYSLELAVFIKEEPLKEFATGVAPGIFSDQNRLGQYIRYHSTNAALIQALVTDSDLNAANGGEYIREALGLPYGVVVIPLRNAAGDALGMIVVAKDFSSSRSAQSRSLVWQILMALFATVLMAGAILIVIRGVLLRPLQTLTAKFTHLADGSNITSEESKPEGLCEELQELAQQYERLRHAREKQ
jgi:hypothetical protein